MADDCHSTAAEPREPTSTAHPAADTGLPYVNDLGSVIGAARDPKDDLLRAVFDIDVSSANVNELGAIYDAMRSIADVCSAIACQPRCCESRTLGVQHTPIGYALVDIEAAAYALIDRVVKEATARPVAKCPNDRERQCRIALHRAEDCQDIVMIAARFLADPA